MKMFQVQFHTGFVPRNATTVKFAKYVGVARGRGREGRVHRAHLPCTGHWPRAVVRAWLGHRTELSLGLSPPLSVPSTQHVVPSLGRGGCQRAPP